VLLVFPGSIGVLFLLGGQIAAGVVLLAVVVVLVVSRAQIAERNVAGGFARARGALLLTKSSALLAIYGVAVWLFVVMRDEHWTRDRHGTVAFWALSGLALFLAREIYRVGEDAERWFVGSDMEREVAAVLDPLRAEGWLITHDVKKDRGGNVDHFVTGPTGAFAIETKSGRHQAADRNHAISNAVWAKQKFGQRWVTAILCVGTDPPAAPEKYGHAWVLGRRDLVGFLRCPTRAVAGRAGTHP
jgi:hypothetical protein